MTEKAREVAVQKGGDFLFAGGLGVRRGEAELRLDFGVVEVEAFDRVVVTAAFDGGPVHDGGGGRDRIAEVGLFVDFGQAGASLAVGEELAGF